MWESDPIMLNNNYFIARNAWEYEYINRQRATKSQTQFIEKLIRISLGSQNARSKRKCENF